ncbi:MAG TPA: hypothetical protein VLA89_06930 [Gemmatimonadales bacterium]|nr:hypothetical protein [Gemmatimonadales bacterium]
MELTPQIVLNLRIEEPDSGATTVREYFQLLLKTLWKEGEGFSGKRPFGNSGWEWDFAQALIKAGVPIGCLDGDGYIEHMNKDEFDKLVIGCIEAL